MRPVSFAALLLVVVALAACQGSTRFAAGDEAFERQDYALALLAYEAAGDPADDPELAARIARTRYFRAEDHVRDLLALERTDEALALLDRLEAIAPPDRRDELAELRDRARRQKARVLTEQGFALMEADREEEAVPLFEEALALDPTQDRAAVLLDRARGHLEELRRFGESLYFEGLDQLRHERDRRALTAFLHGSRALGPDSRAERRLDALLEDLVRADLEMAREALAADDLGSAFLWVRDAERLAPEDPEVRDLAEELAARQEAAALLGHADLAVRGGRPEEARADVAAAAALAPELAPERRNELVQLADEEQHRLDYRLARAYELDGQAVHALELYRKILEESAGFGWEDAAERAARLEEAVAAAGEAWDRAMVARGRGDLEAERDALEEVVRIANDWPGALERLAELRRLTGDDVEPDSRNDD